nr:probable LRR receptor-like serine/threonine-protein kinase At4g36180 [Ipomoea trifida]
MSSSSTFFFFVIFFSAFLSGESLTAFSDVEALKAFKSSIKASTVPSYSCLGSWDFGSADPCSLPRLTHFLCGLTCSADRVTQLVLDKAGYSGTLSPLISKLTQLITLDIQGNNFYGPIPASLSSLPNLQNLVLRANSFSGSVPPSITMLKALQTLDLSLNSLSGSVPGSMNSLAALRRLDLSFNRLAGPIPRLPSSLIELAIKANFLSGSLQKSSFNGLTQLEVVELSQNSFTGTLESWFFQLPALQQVNLANNSFTGLSVPTPTKQNSDLVALDLGFNKIEGYLPVNFASYPVLSSLSLRYNRLRGQIPAKFSKQQSLRRLFLDGNFLKGSPPVGFLSGGTTVSGSLGDNCLQQCPPSSELCLKPQKPASICQQAYGGKPRS